MIKGDIMRFWTSFCVVCASLMVAAGMAEAKAPKSAWTVTRTSDPITGASSCVVAAPDQFGSFKYSRTGYLYPIVENNAQLGLLVGVSSGGKYRLPTGDILWRVDANTFRTLHAIDNPMSTPVAPLFAPAPTGNEATDKAMADAMAKSSKMVGALTATSTVVGGDKAVEMLQEMLAGQALLFRQASTAPSYGLPSSQTTAVGQHTNEGQRPIPLDDSFRRGLAECGISVSTAITSPGG